jgi:hypothetical protein
MLRTIRILFINGGMVDGRWLTWGSGGGVGGADDVKPGEAVFISLKGSFEKRMCHDSPVLAPCIFEYVYFGRPDSTLDGVSVYIARKLVRTGALTRGPGGDLFFLFFFCFLHRPDSCLFQTFGRCGEGGVTGCDGVTCRWATFWRTRSSACTTCRRSMSWCR